MESRSAVAGDEGVHLLSCLSLFQDASSIKPVVRSSTEKKEKGELKARVDTVAEVEEIGKWATDVGWKSMSD